jgi:prepilin-type N-terminal cleavage/methylation domain-containing protein
MANRTGFTLVEVIVATLVFSIGALGLAGSAAAIVRQISANSLRSDAAFIARRRAEHAWQTGCSMQSGEERASGLHSVWSVGGGGVATLDHRVERSDTFGKHGDRFISSIRC